MDAETKKAAKKLIDAIRNRRLKIFELEAENVKLAGQLDDLIGHPTRPTEFVCGGDRIVLHPSCEAERKVPQAARVEFASPIIVL